LAARMFILALVRGAFFGLGRDLQMSDIIGIRNENGAISE